MTDHQFDDLAKALATGATRRSFLKGLGGTALASAFSLLGASRATAGKAEDKDKKKKCRGEGHPCVGNGNVCCDDLICVESGPGRVRRCTAPPAGPPRPQFCGGIGNIACPEGFTCVDDPNDDCDPTTSGRDCGGICVQTSSTTICGPNVCGPDEFCCNESCGICAPIGGSCTFQFCE